MTHAVQLIGVEKYFRKESMRHGDLKNALVNMLFLRSGRERRVEHILKGIDLTIYPGETMGIIGRNGSGKSTLLKILAGIYQPDKGTKEINGRLSALIELGAGFHPEFTGRENIFLNGIILGLTKAQIREKFDSIVAFSGLEKYIDDQVKTYSSGMYMRLAFSIAIKVEPDILVIDEVLAVGDAEFIPRCMAAMDEFKKKGKTIILVTHDLYTVESWCSRAAWISNGKLAAEGDSKDVVKAYWEQIASERVVEAEPEEKPPEDGLLAERAPDLDGAAEVIAINAAAHTDIPPSIRPLAEADFPATLNEQELDILVERVRNRHNVKHLQELINRLSVSIDKTPPDQKLRVCYPSVMKLKKECEFDFREIAYPGDELAYRFDDWVDYYRLKYAIVAGIKPRSILEIGVRYGYSAATFLRAAPQAQYLGVDNNSTSYGGSEGAINWARKITADYNADFLLVDSQGLTELPGEVWDFVHIDGQQDGDGTWRDLEMAMEKARYILVDGFFLDRRTMLATNYIMHKYAQFIETTTLFPEHDGNLLIKMKPGAATALRNRSIEDYRMLADSYDRYYFLTDCGGYDDFKKSGGMQLDERLSSVYLIVDPKPRRRILDIGCGRGELSAAFARAGSKTTGIDYSREAIELARETFGKPEFSDWNGNLEYVCADALEFETDQKFDRVTATDLVEHLDQVSLEYMFEKVSRMLRKFGMFIIHTKPNYLYMTEYYKLKREQAKSVGTWLPPTSNSYYEDLVHLNEQSPEGLKAALVKYFPHVLVWSATLPHAAGTLLSEGHFEEHVANESVFAVASHAPINNVDIISLIVQDPLDETDLDTVIETDAADLRFGINDRVSIPFTVENRTNQRFASVHPASVVVSYHWVYPDREKGADDEFYRYDGLRTVFDVPLRPGEKRAMDLQILTPDTPGKYLLQISLLQESCYWFDYRAPLLPVELEVDILDVDYALVQPAKAESPKQSAEAQSDAAAIEPDAEPAAGEVSPGRAPESEPAESAGEGVSEIIARRRARRKNKNAADKAEAPDSAEENKITEAAEPKTTEKEAVDIPPAPEAEKAEAGKEAAAAKPEEVLPEESGSAPSKKQAPPVAIQEPGPKKGKRGKKGSRRGGKK